jgi:hypothetical protein
MQSLKAQVKNGRILLDEPTELPDGEVVYLAPVRGLVDAQPLADDGLADDERVALHEALEAAIVEADAGLTDDFATVLAALHPLP